MDIEPRYIEKRKPMPLDRQQAVRTERYGEFREIPPGSKNHSSATNKCIDGTAEILQVPARVSEQSGKH